MTPRSYRKGFTRLDQRHSLHAWIEASNIPSGLPLSPSRAWPAPHAGQSALATELGLMLGISVAPPVSFFTCAAIAGTSGKRVGSSL